MKQELYFFCSQCREKHAAATECSVCNAERSTKHYKKGEYVAYQGSKVAHLYMLTKGSVKTEIVSDSGLTLSVEKLVAPSPLAAAFLFAANSAFPVDVVALEDCEVSLYTKASVEKQLASCPHFLRGFLAFNANRIQFLSERLKIFSQRSIKGKIAYYILQREKAGKFELSKSIASLADYFGVERPSLSRALSEMDHAGIITFSEGKGEVLNANALKELLG